MDLWIPVASSDERQTIGPLQVTSSLEYRETVEIRSGNRMIYCHVPAGSPGATVEVSYDVVRSLWQVDPSRTATVPGDLSQFLAPNAKVPTDGFIADQAWSVVEKSDSPLVKARKLYDHLMQTFEYDRAGCTPDRAAELGDLHKACDLQTGTCTEFHGLFVGYCRAVGIPARFDFGFNVPMDKDEGAIAGYHCWAEIVLPNVGWFPVDVTEAIKEAERGTGRQDFFFGGLSCHRVQVSTGRDLWLEPRQSDGPVDKFIFSVARRGMEDVTPHLTFGFTPVST